MANRAKEYGSRVPENFGGNGYPGVADLLGRDKNLNVEYYNSFWHWPEENDDNLSINAGIGKDAFLSHSDQALYADDTIDNYLEVLDFNAAENLLILPFLKSDNVKITQEDDFIVAEIDSGAKDKIFKLSQQATEKNLGFADQFDSQNIQFTGNFKFNTSTKDGTNTSGESIIKPLAYKRKSIDKITNFNPLTDNLEINTDSFDIEGSVTFASGKNKKTVKKKLACSISTFSTTKRGAVFTSTKMEQTKALATVASLPSLKVLLI